MPHYCTYYIFKLKQARHNLRYTKLAMLRIRANTAIQAPKRFCLGALYDQLSFSFVNAAVRLAQVCWSVGFYLLDND